MVLPARHRAGVVVVCALAACTGRIGATDADDAQDQAEDESTHRALRCEGVSTAPKPVIVARLTRAEYISTVQDLFEVDVSTTAAALPFEIRAPFTTTAVAQSTDIKHIEVFSAVSKHIAHAVENVHQRYGDCEAFTPACERAFIAAVAEQLFRRAPRAEEVEGYRVIFRLVEREGDDFVVAATLVFRSMLQSPQFLYHLEDRRGETSKRLAAPELARRIAYLVWQSGPDDQLITAATSGALSTDVGVTAQIRRMAADPRARKASLAFFEDWVDLTRLERAVRGLNDEQKAEMREETERFVEQVLWVDNGGLIDLLDANFTFATPALAERYGLSSAGDGWRRYDLSEEPTRRGLLTQASVLAAHANGNRPAFVSRGLFLLRSMLCRDVPDPTAGVDTNITDLPETASERDKSAERIARGSCGPCHSKFDPLAYAFEGYDGLGVLADTDANGNRVSADGWVPEKFGGQPGTPEGTQYPYANVDGLIDVLVNAPFVRDCLAEKPLGFALRRQLGAAIEDECMVQEIADETDRLGGSYVDLLVAIATHPAFTDIAPTGAQP